MSDERRYTDDEVAEIFEAASRPVAPRDEPADSASPTGLTLARLQEIGREVGIAPEQIAEAAAALDRRRAPIARRTDLGMRSKRTRRCGSLARWLTRSATLTRTA